MNKRGPKPVAKIDHNTIPSLMRLMKYVMKSYSIHFIFVIIFIAISALASVIGTLFIQVLIDD